jgi:putative ABC transport system permease protein
MMPPVGLALDIITIPLTVAVLVVLLLLVARTARSWYVARIAGRNVWRRPMRTALILLGLMLATTFVATELLIAQTVVRTVQTVAVYNLGRVDETITGGSGALGLFPDVVGADVSAQLVSVPHVAGVTPALVVSDSLVVDETTQQARSGVVTEALDATVAGPLGQLHGLGGNPVRIDQLDSSEVYLNAAAAQLMSARPGDTVTLYSTLWPGQRTSFRVRALVSGGLLGSDPTVLLALPALQQLVSAPSSFNRIFVANEGDGLSGVVYSEDIARAAQRFLPHGFSIQKVKEDGVQNALSAEDTLNQILLLFTLLALSVGLLLVFLIFALLAAERRSEIGVSRVLGMHRGRIVLLLMVESAIYDGTAAAPGVLLGLGLSILLVALGRPVIAQLGFPLNVEFDPRALATAFSLGVLTTLGTSALAAWAISRVTLAAALRGQPEPPAPRPAAATLLRAGVHALPMLPHAPRKVLHPWVLLAGRIVQSGLVLLLLGYIALHWAIANHDALAFDLAICGGLAGLVLFVRATALAIVTILARIRPTPDVAARFRRARRIANRTAASCIGVGWILYWALPLDPAQLAGLARYDGGIEIFFAAGMLMVAGATLALAYTLDVVLRPLRAVSLHLRRARHIGAVAFFQPATQRFRTGVTLAMPSLVCFTMVAMACISSSIAQRYVNVPAQTGGYDIVGRPLFKPIGGVQALSVALAGAAPNHASDFVALSEATPLALAVIQPGGTDAGWRLYPVSAVQGAFLDGTGLPLAAHAPGYADDAAVWQDVRTVPGDVVIDVGALSPQDAALLGVTLPPQVDIPQFVAPPIASGLLGPSSVDALVHQASTQNALNGMPPDARQLLEHPNKVRPYTLRLDGVIDRERVMRPTSLWIADMRGGPPREVTVIGLVDNAQGQRYGLLGSPATFAPLESRLASFGTEYYFFKLKPGLNAREEARVLGVALRAYGFETTVIQDALLTLNGPRVFISQLLVGLVGVTLLIGMAALAVTGLRNVSERRQQIGMLRALGFRRTSVLVLFLSESLLIAVLGVGIGVGLALLLCRNVFAVDFFAQFQSGLALVVPWSEVAAICGFALLTGVLASLLPAAQAVQVSPADALRYE